MSCGDVHPLVQQLPNLTCRCGLDEYDFVCPVKFVQDIVADVRGYGPRITFGRTSVFAKQLCTQIIKVQLAIRLEAFGAVPTDNSPVQGRVLLHSVLGQLVRIKDDVVLVSEHSGDIGLAGTNLSREQYESCH